MRIVHVADRLSTRGGADWHLLAVASLQVADGHDVHLISGRVDPGTPTPGTVHRCAGLDDPPEAGALTEAVRRLRADVVHAHNVMAPVALRELAALRAVVTVQDHRVFCPGAGKLTRAGEPCNQPMDPALCAGCFDSTERARRYFEGIRERTAARLAALRGMARVVVLSRYMRDELVAVGLTPGNVEVVPPFVFDLDPDVAPAGPPCVLFVGRLVQAKGVWDALEAWERARLELPLVFAGTGRLRGELTARGAEVTGWLGRAGLAAHYRRARVLLLPSRWQEPFGIVGLEAGRFGVPVVAWRSGGVGDWYRGPAVAWGDVQGLADALRRTVRASPPVEPDARFAPRRLMDRLYAVYAGAAMP